MTENNLEVISPKLAAAIANPLFPAVDSQLRSGKHIGTEHLDNHAFLLDFQTELDLFYRRYNVELIRAPEGFFLFTSQSNYAHCPFCVNRIGNVSGQGVVLFVFKPGAFGAAGNFQYAGSV